MDTSKCQWHKINPKIKIQKTTRLFYGKYLCRLELRIEELYILKRFFHVPITTSEKNWEKVIAMYIRSVKDNSRQSHRLLSTANLDKIDAKQLYYARTFLAYTKLKHRVEGETLHVYSNSEQELFDIVNDSPEVLAQAVQNVSVPKNEIHAQFLKSKKILLTFSRFKPAYRVVIGDDRYTPEVKTQILNFFKNLKDDEYHLPKGIHKSLSSSDTSSRITGYFYIGNPDNLVFLKLICPSFVRNIFEIVSIE